MVASNPVCLEVLWRGMGQGGMFALPIAERRDVVEDTSDRSSSLLQRVPRTRWFLKLLKILSVGAFSRLCPLRLIKEIMPYAVRRA